MSYCVNCGVELAPDAKKCPLCDVEVFNPAAPPCTETSPAYSDRVVLPPASRRRFTAYIISMVMLIPNLVCIMANLLFFSGQRWSFYIAATTALVWVLVVFPFYAKKIRPYLLWAFDCLAVCAYTYFFFALDDADKWFLKCALPVIGVFSLFSLIFMMWVRYKKRGKTQKTIHLMADMIICANAIGFVIGYYYQSRTPIYVCAIFGVAVLALICFLIYCEKSRRMKAWLSRNFFTE